jgi:hypothetical protein
MNGTVRAFVRWPAIGLLALVNLIAISFFFSPGTGDVSIWDNWMREIQGYGLVGGFSHSGTDYPPLAFLILAAVVKISASFGATNLLGLKCSLLFFLWITAACFFWFTRNLVLTAALELSLILSCVGLGYLDIWFAPFLIAAFFLIQRQHLAIGFLCYLVSCAMKYQPLILAPFLCWYVLAAERGHSAGNRKIVYQLAPVVIPTLIIAVPSFLIFGAPALLDSFKRALTYHKILSGYALNLPWIETWLLNLLRPDKYSSLVNGSIDALLVRDPLVVWPNKIVFLLIYAAIFLAYVRQPKTFERLIVYSMLGYLAYFSFNTGVHENHLFLICCLSWILVVVKPQQLVRCLNFNIAANANLFLFFGAFGQRLNPVIAGVDITLLFAVANLCLFAGFLVHTFRTDGLDLWVIKIHPHRTPGAS